MTNGNSADLNPSNKWTDRHKALTEWENKILDGGRHLTTREIACFEDGFEAAREALSVCADGGKDSSDEEPVEESDVRPKERLCGGSHISCNGVDYCLGHPSCRDIANERAEKDKK